MSDPTNATSAIILRESANLESKIITRITAMDKAVDVFHQDLVRFPTQLDKEIARLKDLVMEMFKTVDVKFDGVATEFALRDEARVQTARETKVAVDAALQAASTAVQAQNDSFSLSIAKSETATAQQIEQQRLLIDTTTKALSDKIEDMKDRLARIETAGSQISAQVSALTAASATLTAALNQDRGRGLGQGTMWGYGVGAVGLLLAVGGFILAIVK